MKNIEVLTKVDIEWGRCCDKSYEEAAFGGNQLENGWARYKKGGKSYPIWE